MPRKRKLPPPGARISAEEYRRLQAALETERQFQARVIKEAQGQGWKAAHFYRMKVIIGGKERWITPAAADGKGFTDLILGHEGRRRVIAVECKVRPNKPTPEQQVWLRIFSLAGLGGYVWYPDMWDLIVAELSR